MREGDGNGLATNTGLVRNPDGQTSHVGESRYIQPEQELQVLLKQLSLPFPNQPSPRVAVNVNAAVQNVVKTF
jgi:hypothetical protein